MISDYTIKFKDLRKTDEFLTFFERKCNTNQRMYFDISNDGQEIFLGNQVYFFLILIHTS